MAATSVTLIAQTTYGEASGNYDGSSLAFQSDKFRGDGYYGYTDGLHTVAYYPSSFEGVIKMQGSLATNPTSDDWFDIDGTTLDATSAATSTAVTYNFTGNFVWIRAAVTSFTAGQISRIQANS